MVPENSEHLRKRMFERFRWEPPRGGRCRITRPKDRRTSHPAALAGYLTTSWMSFVRRAVHWVRTLLGIHVIIGGGCPLSGFIDDRGVEPVVGEQTGSDGVGGGEQE